MSNFTSAQLFNGGVSNWQVHLRAASELVLLLHGMSGIDNVDLQTLENQTTLPSQTPPGFPGMSSLLSPNKAALNFFTGAIIWFDILACVSTGCGPYLSHYHKRLLFLPDPLFFPAGGTNPTIELHTIMGCQNWAMVAIAEIESLRTWRQTAMDSGALDISRLAATAKKLQEGLEVKSAEIRRALDALCLEYSGPPPYHCPEMYNTYTTLIVTQIFACAALMHLQTAVSSDPSIINIQVALQGFMEAMSMIPDPRMFRGLVWPLCIAGCMASSTLDRNFFRDSAMGAVKDSRQFGNSRFVLEILDKSWAMQQERGRLIDCSTAIQELGTCVLLV